MRTEPNAHQLQDRGMLIEFADGEFGLWVAHLAYGKLVFRVRADRVPAERAREKGIGWWEPLIGVGLDQGGLDAVSAAGAARGGCLGLALRTEQ